MLENSLGRSPTPDQRGTQDLAGTTAGSLPLSAPGKGSRGKRQVRKPSVTVHHFPAYISNWRDSETRMRLNAAERGVFWELIFYCYKEGSLPADETTLCKIADVPELVFSETWPNVRKSFQFKGGRWHNRKVDEVLPGIERKYEQKRKAGEASAQRKKNVRSTDVEQPLDACSTIEQALTQARELTPTLAPAQPSGEADPVALFLELFDAYPEHRRDKSHLTQSAFVQIMAPLHDEDRPILHAKILDGIRRAKASDDWKRNNGQYVPRLQKFLEEMHWTREYRSAVPEESLADRAMRLRDERERAGV